MGTPSNPAGDKFGRIHPTVDYSPASLANVVTFATKNAVAPTFLYVGRDDTLFLRVFNSLAGVTVRVTYRLLLPDGSIDVGQVEFAPTSDKSVNNFVVPLAEGFLLSAVISPQVVSPSRGQTFASLYLFRGAVVNGFNSQFLVADYLLPNQALGFPGGPQNQPLLGPGWVHTVQQANPAAGADFAFVVPATTRYRVQSLSFVYTASVAVANRQIQLVIDDPSAIIWQASAPTNVTASQAARFVATGVASPVGLNALLQSLVIPPGLLLAPGHRIHSFTTGIDAADQISAVWFDMEEWIVP